MKESHGVFGLFLKLQLQYWAPQWGNYQLIWSIRPFGLTTDRNSKLFLEFLDWREPSNFPAALQSALTCAGHGDDGPVEGLGQRVERRVRLVLLQGVGQACEYQHPHADSHTE